MSNSTKKSSSVKIERRARNWLLEAYPDSAPNNWIQLLDDLHLEFLVSPLHDSDVNGNGETKKPHWHIVMMFDGNKSFEQIKFFSDLIHGPFPIICNNLKSSVRYLIHADNPEKAQYPFDGVRSFGGADFVSLFEVSTRAEMREVQAIENWIRDQGISSWMDFKIRLASDCPDEWYYLATCKYSINFRECIRSARQYEIGRLKDAVFSEVCKDMKEKYNLIL